MTNDTERVHEAQLARLNGELDRIARHPHPTRQMRERAAFIRRMVRHLEDLKGGYTVRFAAPTVILNRAKAL